MRPERWQQVREVLDAALALPAAERAVYLDKACAHDPELRGEVESLLDSHDQAGGNFLNSPAADLKSALGEPSLRSSWIGGRIGVYQIEAEIGHGGMGEVYRAVRADGLYKKEVAIKLVRGGYDTAAVLERFLHERQILASLEHPNIARLYDGGTTQEGLPFLVMELIVGTPIDQYCEEHDSAVHERLKLFTQVCAAVQFAHQRLVIHRDIKPSNILVTADGIPKLLDFGIAKILDPAAKAETTLVRPMTPEYASPEQVRGETITTATDVYSLGVVLYRLLTGHSPYPESTRTPLEFARVICELEPTKPSSAVARMTPREVSTPEDGAARDKTKGYSARRQRRLKGDLDNIALKALRKEPSRRYASVERFAEDMRRHLDGLPVAATRGSWTYRTKKFVRRHRVAAISASVVLMAILAGVVATVREARIAAANAPRAERRFNDVRKLANSFLFEFHDSIEHLQGSTPARELVVKRALEYLDSLSQEAGSDRTLQLELVTAYEKVGAVQGSPYRDNLGNSKGARESFQKAIALLEQLVKVSPSHSDLRSQLARDYGELGDILIAGGNLKAAMECYRKGLDALESDPHPNMKTRIRLEILYDRYGLGLTKTGQLGQAAESFQKSLNALDELIKEDPSDRDNVRDKAVTSIHLADCYTQMRRLTEGLAAYRLAHSLFESLAQPGNAQSARDVGVANAGIAELLLKTGQAKGALAIHTLVLAQDEIAARADPSNALLRRDLYIDFYKLASAQSALGELGYAIANQRKAVAQNEAEAAKDPTGQWRNDLETNYFALGVVLHKAHRNREALRTFEKARVMTESLFGSDPTRTELRADLVAIGMNESDVQLALGDRSAALAGYSNALSTAQSLAASSPENGDWQILLAQLNQKLGEFYAGQVKSEKQIARQKSDREESLRLLRKSREFWNRLQRRNAVGSDYADNPAEVERDISDSEGPTVAQS